MTDKNFNQIKREAEELIDSKLIENEKVFLPLRLIQLSTDFLDLVQELQEVTQSNKFEGFSKNTKILSLEKIMVKQKAILELLKD